MKYDAIVIGMNIRALRENSKMTVEQVGLAVGRSASHISQIEIGSRNMSINLLFDLADLFSVDINSLVGITIDDNQVPTDMGKSISIDSMLKALPVDDRNELISIFHFMIEKHRKVA